VRFDEGPNAFEILDQVSAWVPERAEREYRQEWQERFGLTEEDWRLFRQYGELRRRHFREGDDPVGDAFRGTRRLLAGVHALKGKLDDAEIELLQGFYRHFAPRVAELAGESRPLRAAAARLGAQLEEPAAAELAGQVRRLLGAAKAPPLEILLTAWPASAPEKTGVAYSGRSVVLHHHPRAAVPEPGFLFRELVRHAFFRMSPSARKALADRFLAECPRAGRAGAGWEEALALSVGELVYPARLRAAEPPRFDSALGGDAWASLMAKLLFAPLQAQLARRSGALDELATLAGKLCREAAAAAERVQK
jgi:hypothetical protein